MAITTTQIMGELADREAIRECLVSYARAVDRRDEALLRSVYWPEATDDHLFFKGNADEFCSWALDLLNGMDQTAHVMTNFTIQIKGDKAYVESYYMAYHKRPGLSGGSADNIVGGRYLDRFEKRNDEWRIADRSLLVDWMTEYPESANWAERLPGVEFRTNIKPDDPSFQLFKS